MLLAFPLRALQLFSGALRSTPHHLGLFWISSREHKHRTTTAPTDTTHNNREGRGTATIVLQQVRKCLNGKKAGGEGGGFVCGHSCWLLLGGEPIRTVQLELNFTQNVLPVVSWTKLQVGTGSLWIRCQVLEDL